jgi:hypothetical protein
MTVQPKTQELQELVIRKASELVTMFTNYLKDKKVCEGRIGVEAVQDGYVAALTVATVRPSVMNRYCLGMRLLRAYYDEEKDIYKLSRYSQPVGRRQDAIPVGSYGSAEELMKAVSDEVAKL